jgi:hypothetical protein
MKLLFQDLGVFFLVDQLSGRFFLFFVLVNRTVLAVLEHLVYAIAWLFRFLSGSMRTRASSFPSKAFVAVVPASEAFRQELKLPFLFDFFHIRSDRAASNSLWSVSKVGDWKRRSF